MCPLFVQDALSLNDKTKFLHTKPESLYSLYKERGWGKDKSRSLKVTKSH